MTNARSARRLLLALCLGASLAPAAAADTVWVVDAAMGTGADFPTIQAAVDAAAAGDTILVRTGVYPSFTLITKNLAVVADAGATVRVVGGPYVASTPPGQPNILHGLRFDPDPSAGDLAFFSPGDSGARNWVNDCVVSQTRVMVTSSITVFDHCTLNGRSDTQLESVGSGSQALDVRFSFAAAYDTVFQGGNGAGALLQGPQPATPGGPGVFVDTFGSFWGAGCTISGGAGGSGVLELLGTCSPGADGGAGLELRQGYVTENTSQFQGGLAGAAASGCPGTGGQPGPDLDISTTTVPAFYTQLPGDAPSLWAPGVAREGQALTFDWQGPAGLALLLVSGSIDFLAGPSNPAGPQSMPLLVGSPFSLQVVGSLSGAGTASKTYTVPNLAPGVESKRVYAQALHLDPANLTVYAGGARAVVLLDGAF